MSYAKCSCGHEMKPGSSCHIVEMKGNDGKWYKRLPNDRGQCHDCNAGSGKIHHWGCDSERCPVCHGQLMGGDCDGGCFDDGSGSIEMKVKP